MAIDSRSNVSFDKLAHRLSFFNQLIVSRKISRLISAELSVKHAHFNLENSSAFKGIKNDNLSVDLNAKFRVKG